MASLIGKKVTLRRSFAFEDGNIAKRKDGSHFFEIEDFTIEAVNGDKAIIKSLGNGHTEEISIELFNQ